VRAWQDRLDETDRLALRVFGQLSAPGVQEMGLTPVVFEALGLTMTGPEALGFVARLSVLYAHASAKGAAAQAQGED
jgi:hypothetical protein